MDAFQVLIAVVMLILMLALGLSIGYDSITNQCHDFGKFGINGTVYECHKTEAAP